MPQQQPHPHHPMVAYGHHEGDYHPQTSQSVKQGYPSAAKSKNQSLTLSDDDEPGFTAEKQLLIMVVFYIGDEVGSEGMIRLAKRRVVGFYRRRGNGNRVNDILGKGTSCRVVENQSLLDTMDHLSPKMKEEVKKLLNSKHLFFREMCAYHNSCGHGSGASVSGTGGVQHSPPEAAAEPSQAQLQLQHQRVHERGQEDDINDTDERSSRKKLRKGTLHSPLIQQLDAEIMNMLQDGTKSPSEKRQWMKTKLIRLEEQRVGIQSQSFELEKQRLKWLKFSSKKEREMEREKLTNERLKLENERMLLLIRQKELDLLDLHQQQQQHSSNKKSDPSSITG
ncbi:hypothetical protein Pfo_028682 [Paulownia fortunei]|nr:hypothetical protein Pfo_028682 [Paulownia fortunei]